MSKFMNNLVRNRKKGFTLVELIVVLVILAILLAILVPALTKWIDKAKEKQILVEARSAYLACQTIASEAYGGINENYVSVGKLTDLGIDAAEALAQVTGTITRDTVTLNDDYKVTGMTYTDDNGYSVSLSTTTVEGVTTTSWSKVTKAS